MNAHTPGPLRVEQQKILNGYEFNIQADYFQVGKLFGSTNPMWDYVPGAREGEANARRIVACWNACDEMPTEMLEGFSPRFLATYPDRVLAERRVIEAQRDELLVALQLAQGIAMRVIADVKYDESQLSDWRPIVNAAVENARVAPITTTPETPVQVDITCPGGLPKCKWVPMLPAGSRCETCGDSIPF